MPSLADLMMHYPDIPWCEPIKVALAGDNTLAREDDGALEPSNGWHYACRVCIATYGLNAKHIALGLLARTEDAVREHIRKEHAS